MRIAVTKYLVSVYLLFALVAGVAGQEKRFSFTWLDRNEKKLAGQLSVNLTPPNREGACEVTFSVLWFNESGNPVTEAMPVLCLSKYDFDLFPPQKIVCTSFEQKRPFNLVFQSTDKLNCSIVPGFQGSVRLVARFRYALTRDQYEAGRSELIDLNGQNSLTAEFLVKTGHEADDSGILADSRKIPAVTGVSYALRAASGSYNSTLARVRLMEEKKNGAEAASEGFLTELDEISFVINREKSLLNIDSLPADSFQVYRERYNRLNESVLDMRAASLRLRMAGNRQESDPVSRPLAASDSIRNRIRLKYEPVIQLQADSLRSLAEKQKNMAAELSELLINRNQKGFSDPMRDTLIAGHQMLRQEFQQLILSHERTWKEYRIQLNGYVPVREVESLHSAFQNDRDDLRSAFDQVDRNVKLFQDQDTSPWYQSNRVLWIALLALLVLIFVTAIWSSARNRKIIRERLMSLEAGNSASLTTKTGLNGILEEIIPSDYYTLDFTQSIPESAIGKVHLHIAPVKTVYHLVQGALLERKGGDFGGYLFGNQYKLPGKGPVKSEIFIEKACDSKYLRSSLTNDVNARADLVDELDAIVRQNKKYRLIGWFTSAPDSSLEIPEGLMKIHRSFFRDRWQTGILINPTSDVLQSAAFMRRTSGYLDPLPDPAAFIKWDEIYNFALNPAVTHTPAGNGVEKTAKEYTRIVFNNTWGDSVVATAGFDPAVVSEILAAAANQAIPKDTYQVVGYLYGSVRSVSVSDNKAVEYEVFVDRFLELGNESAPRELPGMTLIGWWGQASVDVLGYLQDAIDYHELTFKEAYQVACLANPASGELRIFTRKHSLDMNNSTIETEEYSINTLLSH